MTPKAVLTLLGVGAIALLAFSSATLAQDRPGVRAYAAGYKHSKARRYRQRPLEVYIYRGRRPGGYSYRPADVISTYGSNPPPWAEVRQTPSGPFDSGFFFDSGISPRGGNSPYQH
jgi:hypothetical protein